MLDKVINKAMDMMEKEKMAAQEATGLNGGDPAEPAKVVSNDSGKRD